MYEHSSYQGVVSVNSQAHQYPLLSLHFYTFFNHLYNLLNPRSPSSLFISYIAFPSLFLAASFGVAMAARSVFILVMASLLVHRTLQITFSSRLIHRFSDEVRAFRISRNVKVTGSWPERRSLEYYRMLSSSDLQRQKMKLGPQYQFLFPAEGSKTMSFGNDFGWYIFTLFFSSVA